MTEPPAPASTSADGLWRWLLGGLAGGAVILGLLIAAYAIGYHRGEHKTTPAAATSSSTTTTTTSRAAASPITGPVPVTAALVAQGRSLYQNDGCSACHSLTGSPGVGPTWKALAGSQVRLANGQTVTATDAYLAAKIADPRRTTVAGFPTGVMAAAIAGDDLASKANQIRALVAFIKSLK